MKGIVLVALAAAFLGSGASAAEEKNPPSASAGSHFKLAMITSDKYSQDERGVFAPDAPKVFAVYRVVAGSGMKMKAVWLAEKVAGLEPKSKITENPETTFSAKGEYIGSFACSKPPQGWPVGTYAVNLYMDGVLKKTLAFRVEKN